MLMRCVSILILCLTSLPLFSAEKILLIFKDGKEVFGTVVMEKEDKIIIKSDGKMMNFNLIDVTRWIRGDRFDKELEKRKGKLKKEDTLGRLKLAMLAIKVEKKDFAAAMLKEALNNLSAGGASAAKPGITDVPPIAQPTPSSPNTGNANSGVDVPWPPDRLTTLKLEVRKRYKTEVSEVRSVWLKVANRLAKATPSFAVHDYNSARIEADYTARLGFDIRLNKVNKMFGGVPITNEWGCVVRFTVRSARTNKTVHTVTLPTLKHTCSVNLDGESQVLREALKKFEAYLDRTRGFMVKKRAS